MGQKNEFGTGGIYTKIEAAKLAVEYDIPMILTNGKKENVLMKLMEGKEIATLFLSQPLQ